MATDLLNAGMGDEGSPLLSPGYDFGFDFMSLDDYACFASEKALLEPVYGS